MHQYDMTCLRPYPLQYGFAIIVNGIWVLYVLCVL